MVYKGMEMCCIQFSLHCMVSRISVRDSVVCDHGMWWVVIAHAGVVMNYVCCEFFLSLGL